MLYNAAKSGDQQQVQQIMQGLGANGYKMLMQKAQNLQNLSQHGSL